MPGAGAWIRPYRDGFRVYFRKEPGGVLGGSRVFPTEEEADALADELRGQINARRRTVGDALEAYQEDMKTRGLAASTIHGAGHYVKALLSEVLELPLAALTPRRCENLYTKLVDSKKYKAGTHHLTLKHAKAFGVWCAHRRRRWFKESPFAVVEKVGESADHRAECLRVDEARKLRDKAFELANAGDAGALMALVILTCSIRPSEVLQLEARDVDDGGAVLWIAGDTVKTKNTRRPLEVADSELRELLASRAKGRAATDRLFSYSRQHVTELCKKVAVAAGVPATNPRELRRTFATLTARRGRSLDELSFSLGHGADANARTAQRHYVAPGARESGQAGRLFGVLDGGKKKRAKSK